MGARPSADLLDPRLEVGMVQFKRLLIKFPWNALSFGIRKAIPAKIIKEMCQFFVNIPDVGNIYFPRFIPNGITFYVASFMLNIEQLNIGRNKSMYFT